MLLRVVTGLLLAMAAVSPASAAILHFNFEARVDQTNALVPVGTRVTGSVSYDGDMLPTHVENLPDGYGTWVAYERPSIQLSISFGGTEYRSQAAAYAFYGEEDGYWFLIAAENFSFGYQDRSKASFTAPVVPTWFPALAQIRFPDPNDDDEVAEPHGSISFFNPSANGFFDATLLHITPAGASAVPEPAALGLLGLGLIGCAGLRRRRA